MSRVGRGAALVVLAAGRRAGATPGAVMGTYFRKRPPQVAAEVARAFREHEPAISTVELSQETSLRSDDVLDTVRPELEAIEFEVETGKAADEEVYRPAVFGKNGEPDHRYAVDGYHEGENCVIEVEAGRARDSNHTHRNLIRAMTMVDVEVLAMAVPRKYKHSNSTTPAFDNSRNIAETLYRTERVDLPFRLVLLDY